MFFSVIIPAANRLLITNCLDALERSISCSSVQVEVIVTDDSKDDLVKDILAKNYMWVKYLRGPKAGPAANRNNGALHAQGEWLIFLDDDVVPTERLFEAYLKEIVENQDVSGFEGAILTKEKDRLTIDLAEVPLNENGNCFWSANICIRKDIFFRVGGFCELYTIAANEDQDLFEQLKKVSKVKFVKDAYVWHNVRIPALVDKLGKVGVFFYSWMILSKRLNYSFLEIYFKGIKTQLIAFIYALRKKKPKCAVLAFYTFFYCLILCPFVWLKATCVIRKHSSDRHFFWKSSVIVPNVELEVLQYRMQHFYSSNHTRGNYQEMIDSNNAELSDNPVFAQLVSAIEKSNDKKILEVGCGNGKLFKGLNLAQKSNYYGMEVSERVISINKSNYPEANWICGQVYSLPFEDSFFDNVVSFYVLEHLVYPERALAEMMRVLKKGGSLVLVFPDFIETKRLPSQFLGLSGNGTAKTKVKNGKLLDAIVTLYDSRIRLINALKGIEDKVGEFLVNTNPKCLQSDVKTDADFDAVYIASKKELALWANKNNYGVEYPAGIDGLFKEHSLIKIRKV